MAPFRLRHADIFVGLFVIAAVATVAVTSFMVLKGSQIFEDRFEYWTIFKEAYGIAPGNTVTIASIEVGTVESVELLDNNKVKVLFMVRDRFRRYVREDSVVEVKSPPGLGGFLGGTGLKVSVGGLDASELSPGSFVKGLDPVGLDELLSFIQEERFQERGEAALERIEKLLAALGDDDGPVQTLLRDASGIVADVRGGKGSAGKFLNDKGRLLRRVEGLVDDVRGKVAAIDPVLADLKEISGSANAAVQQTPEAVRKVNVLLDRLGEVMATASDAIRRLTDATEKVSGVAGDVPRLMGEVEGRLKDLEEILDGLRKNFLVRMYLDEPEPPRASDPGLQDLGGVPP